MLRWIYIKNEQVVEVSGMRETEHGIISKKIERCDRKQNNGYGAKEF